MARLLIDAMNLIGSRADGWWNDPDRAMRDLVLELDAHAAKTGEQITVVFDKNPGRFPEHEHVDVVVARRRGPNAADYEIDQLIEADETPGSIRVVTSDRRLVDKVRASGARVVGSGTFRRRLDAS